VGEVRGGVEEGFALVESLAYELVLFIVQLEDRFLEVANATVHKLGGLGGSS
jgi:hypothetical protein